MEAHDRLMSVPTTGLIALGILDEEYQGKSFLIQQLLRVCTKKLSNDYSLDLKILETLRMILCYEYQTFMNSGIRLSYCQTNEIKIDMKTFFPQNIEHFTDTKEFALLSDIATLELALSCNETTRFDAFNDIYESQRKTFEMKRENLRLCLKVFECIADSYDLHSRLHEGERPKEQLEKLPDCILKVIESWIEQKEHTDWRILASLLPKLVSIFGAPNVVSPILKKVLGDRYNELDKVLSLLCVMTDVCFPTEPNSSQQIPYEYCISTTFWSVLLRGLDSSIYHERKKAVHLMKRALDFIDSHESKIRFHANNSNAQMVPFIRTNDLTRKTATNAFKKIFFHILESLEEKQKQFVLPALVYIPNLVEAFCIQKFQGYVFHKKWLQCIFKRILKHDDIAIKKIGLREALQADLDMYDEDFIDFLANCLNNVFLYDFDCFGEDSPEIVLQLADFFSRSERAEMPLINVFVRAISKVSWHTVAIHWVLQAFVVATDGNQIIHNVWTQEELRCIRKVFNLNLTEDHTLLAETLSVLREMLCKYVTPNFYWPDVELVAGTIYSIGGIQWIEDADDHIRKMITAADAQAYIVGQCDTLWSGQSTESFANIIVFLDSLNLILSENDCRAESRLHELFQTLSDAQRSSPTDTNSILKVLELAAILMNRSRKIVTEEEQTPISALERLLAPHIQTIADIVQSCIGKTLIPRHEHSMVTTALIRYNAQEDLDYLKCFYERCIDIVVNPRKLSKHHWLFALRAAHVYNEHCFRVLNHPVPSLSTTKIQSVMEYFKNDILNGQFDKKIIEECCNIIAALIGDHVVLPNGRAQIASCLDDLRFLIVTSPGTTIEVVLKSIVKLLQPAEHQQPVDDENFKIISSIIELSSRLVFLVKNPPKESLAICVYLKLISRSYFLEHQGCEQFAIEYVSKLVEEGKKFPELRTAFVTDLFDEQKALLFLQPFICCFFHGISLQRERKIENAAASCYGASGEIDYPEDKIVLAYTIIAMMDILEKVTGLESRFRSKILQEFISILKKYRNKRHLHGSHVHRIKHRTMQALLVLEPYLNDAEAQKVYAEMCDSIIAESNQPSVQLMQEWLIVRIYAKSLMDESIWTFFKTAMEKRPGSIVSVVSIVYHISKLIQDQPKIDFIFEAISFLLPNCMGHQFNVRLYSQIQVILVEIYEMLPEYHRDTYASIFERMQTNLHRRKIAKIAAEVMDDFYYKEFHAHEDFDLQMIYEHLPRLMGLPADERIEASIFNSLMDPNDYEEMDVDSATKWETIEPRQLSTKSVRGGIGETIDPTNEQGCNDIQKKATQWKSITPLPDELAEVSKATLKRKITSNSHEGIIVVASLISRPRNLGDLARTCEIFGAKELVIASLKSTSHRAFQKFSSFAEELITITEVKKNLLKNYLLQQRSQGWKLVGAEQSTNSINLLEMKFDKKTILLLGNEEKGIPADLLPLLDTCVEIRQNGIIRSPNIQVTGAICIWQYAKQHVFI